MLYRKVITEYWCGTCGYTFVDDGVTVYPWAKATGKQLFRMADGQTSQVPEQCPACHPHTTWTKKKE